MTLQGTRAHWRLPNLFALFWDGDTRELQSHNRTSNISIRRIKDNIKLILAWLTVRFGC